MKRHPYRDRRDAGQALAAALTPLAGQQDRATDGQGGGSAGIGGVSGRPLVLALPRGGVPVAAEVADVLGAELDVLVVRKVGVPAHPELAMGALALLGGTMETVRNEDVLTQIPGAQQAGGAFDAVAEREGRELARRDDAYRAGRPPVQLGGRMVILVDDGLATGATMRAALIAARRQNPARLIAAVPVGSRLTLAGLEELADDVVSAWVSESLGSVGQAYEKFTQTSDDEVRGILAAHPAAERP